MSKKTLEQEMWNSKTFEDRWDFLSYVLSAIKIEGLILEFGVYKGKSINFISEFFPDEQIFGFDSFVGLPEPWNIGNNVYVKGYFSTEGKLPEVNNNVKLIKGFFEDTIQDWKKDNLGNMSFIHIDSDLYSSAKTILTQFNDRIISGTIILFDEICSFENNDMYLNWKEGEWKAFNEWIEKYKRSVRFICRDKFWRSAIEILK